MPSAELTSPACVSHSSPSSHYEFTLPPVTIRVVGHRRHFAFNVSLSVGCPTKGDLVVRWDFPKQMRFSSTSEQSPRRKGANSQALPAPAQAISSFMTNCKPHISGLTSLPREGSENHCPIGYLWMFSLEKQRFKGNVAAFFKYHLGPWGDLANC